MKTGILKNNVEESAPRQTKVEQLGRNTGNLVFWEALDRLFCPEKIPYAQSERLSSCDRVIVTDLIWIRENAEYGYLEKLADKYAIPFIPISVGLQAEKFDPGFRLSANTLRLLKKLEERATLGVRGQFTADVLEKHGVKNLCVIGCPSMYYWNNPEFRIDTKAEPQRASANFKTFFGRLSAAEKHFLSYCAQHDMQFVEQTELPFTRENARDEKFFQYIKSWLDRRSVLPCGYREWCDALNGIDFSLGGRFHGNVIALWNGIRSLFLTTDSRTRELTDFFGLPAMEMQTFDETKPLSWYYDRADYTRFNSRYPKLYKNFVNFAQKNGLDLAPAAQPLTFARPEKQRPSVKKSDIGVHNAVYLSAIARDKNKIAYKFSVEGNLVNYFSNSKPFTVEYDCNTEMLPDSVAVLPFAALLLPLCWLADATLVLPEADEDFCRSLRAVKRGYEEQFPELSFGGKVVAEKVVKNRADHLHRSTLCLYGGGVSSAFSVLSELYFRPLLFSVCREGQSPAGDKLAEALSLRRSCARTTFRCVLKEEEAERVFLGGMGENRRKNFFTALAPCAHVAPYAFLQNMTDICLPSAEGTEGAEQPRILTAMSFCGCRVRQENCFSQREQLLQISENRDFMQALLRSDEAAAKALQRQ